MCPHTSTYLDTESEHRHHNFKDERQAQLPYSRVYAKACWAVGDVIDDPAGVHVVPVVTERGGLQGAAVREELPDELTGVEPRVRVREGDHGGDGRHCDDLQDRVLPKPGGFAPTAPGNVRPDEKGSPQPSKHPEQDEGEQFKQVPWRVILHIKQDQAAVTKRVDGSQNKRSHQGSKERPPQGFQRKVIADLGKEGRGTKALAYTTLLT